MDANNLLNFPRFTSGNTNIGTKSNSSIAMNNLLSSQFGQLAPQQLSMLPTANSFVTPNPSNFLAPSSFPLGNTNNNLNRNMTQPNSQHQQQQQQQANMMNSTLVAHENFDSVFIARLCSIIDNIKILPPKPWHSDAHLETRKHIMKCITEILPSKNFRPTQADMDNIIKVSTFIEHELYSRAPSYDA
jgi:hypothetical protein